MRQKGRTGFEPVTSDFRDRTVRIEDSFDTRVHGEGPGIQDYESRAVQPCLATNTARAG
jgi:hypothetical protein